ncbi:hypothetical protein [Planctomicrobium sp. SH664]|uniref:hypothetical protein n=1 Tax=Planctomicrobium sp. SH664 TaxID=3448125 RepID=UPI003F5BB964
MTTRIVGDESGDLRTGYFYRWYAMTFDVDLDIPFNLTRQQALRRGVIIRPALAQGTAVYQVRGEDVLESRVLFECPEDSRHEPVTVDIRADAELAGDVLNPLVPGYGARCVDSIMSEQLLKCGLIRERPTRLEIEFNQSAIDNPEIYMLISEAPNPAKPSIVDPPSENRCPFCGYGPLVCSTCGDIMVCCFQCEKITSQTRYYRKGKEDPTVLEDKFPHLDVVMDPRRWSGSHYMTECIITKRFLDWLLAAGACPFVATPLRTDVRGLTESEWSHLKTAQAPLTQRELDAAKVVRQSLSGRVREN